MKRLTSMLVACVLGLVAHGAAAQRVVDLPTRAGVTQRFLYEEPAGPLRALAILLPGGSGGIVMTPSGSMVRWGEDNFVVRTRGLLHKHGIATAVLDAPSDRPPPRSLNGFRQTAGHVEDLKAVIAWLRARHAVPVWTMGFSAGSLSAIWLATQLPADQGGPDGVAVAGALVDNAGEAFRPATDMDLKRITVPLLVAHHEADGCKYCSPVKAAALANLATSAPRRGTLMFSGGQSRGDPCHEWAHHGFNGIEADVVRSIAEWMLVGQ